MGRHCLIADNERRQAICQPSPAVCELPSAVIIHVKLYASLRRYRPGLALGQSFVCTVADGLTIGQLIADALHLPAREVAISLVNGCYQDPEYRLGEGDHVALWPPIAGGAWRSDSVDEQWRLESRMCATQGVRSLPQA